MLWYATGRHNPGPVCSRETMFGSEIFSFFHFFHFPCSPGVRDYRPPFTGLKIVLIHPEGELPDISRNINCLDQSFLGGVVVTKTCLSESVHTNSPDRLW